MSKKTKLTALVLCLIIVLTSFCLSAGAVDMEKERVYKPLDLVVVLDSSGSMVDSDPDRTALAAVRMLVNMMPAGDSKIGVISFNREATVITKNASGKATLLGLNSLSDVATIKKNVSDVVYRGATGIGNAVIEATELLAANDNHDRAKAIILFTDGVNDFGNDVIALSKCEENEANAIMWAKKNDCPIYSVGYDYILDDGTSSMGKEGEGLKKLENIASQTNGKFKAINSIAEIHQLLIEFLADVCDLNYTTVATIPGDGGKHECIIPVSPNVVEANVRIAGGDGSAIGSDKIKLFDPDGNQIELRNSGNVRFDTDAAAASVKITMPKTGEWLLVVEGITGEDIHVGLLEHFKMNLTSVLSLPDGNPEGVAYTNDEVGIRAWLTYDGKDLNDEALYAAVKSATAVCVPRTNPENKKIVTLARDGYAFTGSFVIPQDCCYDITVRLDWETVYREDTLEIQSSNKPLYQAGEFPGVVKVNKNKTATLTDIYQYVQDDENDKITASISSVSSPNTADVSISGNDLIVTGRKMSSSVVTVEFADANGNTVSFDVKVKVNNPLVWILLALIIIAGAAVALLVPYLSYKKSLRIRGTLYLAKVEGCTTEDDYENVVTFDFTDEDGCEGLEGYENALSISMDRYYRKKEKRTVKGLISETLDLFKYCEPETQEYEARSLLNGKLARDLMVGTEKSKIIGTPNGGSFTVKLHKKTPFLTANKSRKSPSIHKNKLMELCFRVSGKPDYIKLQYYFVSPVHERKSSKR